MLNKKDIKQKAVSSIIWVVLQKYSTMCISFISGIILARLLTPYDYGCIGMLSIFMVLSEAFIDGGFGSALIQKKRPTQVDYSTIFFWNVGMSVIMYSILFISAPAVARFYNIPLLSSVLRVQGFVLLIYAFNIIQRNQLQKKLNFKVLSIVTIITSLISLVVTVFMAYNGFGVWSLVAQNLITASIPALVFWFYLKWKPDWTFSWLSFKELFNFGFFMFLTSLLNQFGQQIQGLLIGKVYNPSTMGYYSKAHETEKLASTSISSVMTQVTYPLYAEVQDDKTQLGYIIKRITMTLSYITWPLMFILLICAKPIIVLLYSYRWISCVPYFQVLCISGLAYCLQSANIQSIAAVGRSRTMFKWTVVKRTVGILGIAGGLMFYGMKGLLAGVVFGTWFAFFVNISLVSKYIGYRWTEQLFNIMPVAIVSVISALVAYGFGAFLNLPLYYDGIVKLVVFAFVYFAWSFLFKPEAYVFFIGIIAPIVRKLKSRL